MVNGETSVEGMKREGGDNKEGGGDTLVEEAGGGDRTTILTTAPQMKIKKNTINRRRCARLTPRAIERLAARD